MGNRLGAQYVMTGSITSLGSQRLLIVSIINLHDIQQVAGDYLRYNSIDDVIKDTSILNNMAANLVKMVRNQKDDLPPLAVLRVRLEGGAKEAEGDAMAQILAIHLLYEGKWAVCPRVTQEQVQSEYETQLQSGTTRKSEQVRVGEAMVPRHVLAVVSRVIGTTTTFIADITVIEDGIWYDGSTEVYTSLNDGMNVMGLLAKKLSGGGSERDQTARVRAVKTEKFLSNLKAGLAFGGWFGGGNGTGAGVPKTSKDKETGEEKTTSDPSFSGGGSIELRYRFLGIQTGLNFISDHAIYTPTDREKQYTELLYLQIPVLARLNLEFLKAKKGAIGMTLSGFAGFGLNPAVLSSDTKPSPVPGWLSFIAGAELGYNGVHFSLTAGYQYNGGIIDGSITDNGASYDFKSGIHMVCVSLKYYMPFQKDD
jgi:hypothetical protein